MKRCLRFISAVTALFLFSVLPYGTVGAQSNALSINPRRNYTVQPGETVNDRLSVGNINTEAPLSLVIDVVDFSAQGETGSPTLNNDLNTEPTAWSLRKYIKLPKQLTLEKGKSTEINMSIAMPKDIGAGSYYSAIRYSVVNPEDPTKLNVAASSVTLIFVDVSGTAKELLTFKQFGAFVPDSDSTTGTFSGLFIDKQPTVLSYKVKNDGNLAEQPKGSMIVKSMFGKTVAKIPSANPKQQLALLGQTRRFDACIKGEKQTVEQPGGSDITTEVCKEPGLKPGRYTALLTLLYGANGGETREITAATSFWYLPWWFIAVALVILGLIAGAITFLVFKIRGMRSSGKKRR